MLVLNLPFKALMFLTLMRPSLVLFLVLWLKLVKDFLNVRCRLALLPFLISCLIWLDLVACLPLIKESILLLSFPTRRSSDLPRIACERDKDNQKSSSRRRPGSIGSTARASDWWIPARSEEHTSELQSRQYLVCRLLLEKKNAVSDKLLDLVGLGGKSAADKEM